MALPRMAAKVLSSADSQAMIVALPSGRTLVQPPKSCKVQMVIVNQGVNQPILACSNFSQNGQVDANTALSSRAVFFTMPETICHHVSTWLSLHQKSPA